LAIVRSFLTTESLRSFLYLESVAPTHETAALINIDKKNDKQIVTESTTVKEGRLEDEKLILTSNEF
jgi:hypothetical protein